MYKVAGLLHNGELVGYRVFSLHSKAICYDVSLGVIMYLGLALTDVTDYVNLYDRGGLLVSAQEDRLQVYARDISDNPRLVLSVFKYNRVSNFKVPF